MPMYRSKTPLALVAALSFSFGAALHAQYPVGDSAGKFVTVFGAKIYYLDRGTGPTVVLIHGLGDEADIWDQSIGPLSKNHRVVALDLIGFGHSDKPLLDYRPDTFVDFLVGFLDALHIDRASFVGNSLGGMVAAELAIRNPTRADRLVLVDAAGYSSLADSLNGRMATALRLSTRDDYRVLTPFTFYSKKFYPSEADLDAAIAERVKRGDGYTIRTTIESLMRRDGALDGRLGAITSPTLIVWGRGDRLIPLSFGERFKRDIKGSRLQVIEKCGHIPQVECPADLNAALLQFLPGKGAN
jgi:2-hydroxy-6-oxonona-2,4-dienedioate hydrolase